jgi:hypothetical protein
MKHDFTGYPGSLKKCNGCGRWFHNEGDMDIMYDDDCPHPVDVPQTCESCERGHLYKDEGYLACDYCGNETEEE